MDDSLYDEFGNYLGPELPSSEDEEAIGDDSQVGGAAETDYDMVEGGGTPTEESTTALMRMEGKRSRETSVSCMLSPDMM